ncbi:GerAB/ArcD/ProY family transporter [Alkalihalobacterium elongatum]|uniref:GerAB/ArcD/ProY family transporter n=1 Tax=Alkalihalobacterium elongatum TaxID=2675466 RepID=UPI001C1FB135|nr:endospore germination permease [Alkalihalobacterium elongatum]
MKHTDAVSFFALILIIITSVGLMNHVIIIPALLESAGRDAWVSVICACLVALIWVPLIYFITKKTKQENLYLWLSRSVGKGVAAVIVGAISVYLLVLATVTIIDLSEWTVITYLPRTPSIVIVIVFSVLCFLAAITNLRTIATINGILLPVVIVFGLFVMLANEPNKDYSLLQPVLERGFDPSIYYGMIYSGAGLVEIIVILFIQHKVKPSIKLVPILLTTAFLATLTLGPLIGAIVEFGPAEAARQRFPAYEEWALVTIGRFIEHVDFLSIYQWLTGAFIRITFLLFLVPEIFNVHQPKKRAQLLAVFFSLMIAMTLIPRKDFQFLFFISTYLLPFSLIFVIALSILLLTVTFLSKKKGNDATHEIT